MSFLSFMGLYELVLLFTEFLSFHNMRLEWPTKWFKSLAEIDHKLAPGAKSDVQVCFQQSALKNHQYLKIR